MSQEKYIVGVTKARVTGGNEHRFIVGTEVVYMGNNQWVGNHPLVDDLPQFLDEGEDFELI